jgi:hypothetical protein
MEKKREFLPPVFVDLRIARKVRAANFRGDEFKKIVGSRSYVWEHRLGNKRILSKKGKRIQIADPAAASHLLDRIVYLSTRRRRVIMFCACEAPLLKSQDGLPSCHRVEVARLLLETARKRDLRLELSEWPGEKRTSMRVKASDSQRRALRAGARCIPIGSIDARLPAMAVLGWGSDIRFESPEENWTVVTGPARVGRGQWRLEIVAEGAFTGRAAKTTARRRADELLRAGYGRRSTNQ